MRSDIRQGRRSHGHSIHGFTIIEILVVVAIIALLLSILLPALGRARMQAKMVACKANLHGIGRAFAIYTEDSKGFYPHVYDWYSEPKYYVGVRPAGVTPQDYLGIGGWAQNGTKLGEQTYRPGQLYRYAKSVEAFTCPQDLTDAYRPWGLDTGQDTAQPPPGTGSYSITKELWNLDTDLSDGFGNDPVGWYKQSILLQTPSRVLLIFEQKESGHFNDASAGYYYTVGLSETSLSDNDWVEQEQINDTGLTARHGGMGSFLLFDGHVEHRIAETQFNAGRRIISVKTGVLFDKVYADHPAGIFRFRAGVKKGPDNPQHSIIWPGG